MAKNLRSVVLKNIDKDHVLLKKYKDEFSIEKILAKIHYVRILDDAEQNLLHTMFEKVIQKLPNLKLICIDTFAEHFRQTDSSYADRKRAIATSLMGLQRIAHKHQICVVLINNMKTGKKDFSNRTDGTVPSISVKPEPLFGEELF
mmetsp:Transcript_2206/g.1542  ORF Transcript_2206/g.1542 Transcript_2206/m.1542 type:complete len:146 (-) Transcript_2206:197-634(-)